MKNINAMQGFGSMDVLCVDKTGTLTGDRITLEYYMDVLGNESTKVLDFAYLNSLYHTGVKNHLDSALLQCRTMPGHEAHFQELASQYPKLDERPFDYERRFASVLVKHREANLLIIKGGIDEVCCRCISVEYKGERRAISGDGMESVRAVVDEILEDGMKVLAVAYKPLKGVFLSQEDEHDFILLGYLAFFDAPKESAAGAIRKLQNLHVGVRVLTGDHRDIAVSICRRLGIDTTQSLTGRDLEQLSEEELPIKIERTTLFAELSPKQKVQVVQLLRANGHTVGFLGDGMNDLPAIAEADVGISVDTAAEAVKEGADVILLKKDLNVLEAGIQEGRKAFANVSKYIKITASSNFGNILSIVIASVFLPFFPMTSLQLLLLNLLYDILCLALPWDHVDAETCTRPLEWSGRTLGRFMRFFGPISSCFDILTFVAFLKENNEYIRNLVQDYVESKTRLAMLYDTDPTHIKEQQEKAVAEADKLIANKILDVIRTMLCKDREVQSFEYTEARKAYFTEQMICEILIALEQAAMSFDMEYDDRQKAMSTELSKAARKEWYLRHKDKGVEP